MKNPLKISPKTYMVWLLLTLCIIGVVQQGYKIVYLQLMPAISTSIILDFTINYLKAKRTIFPSSAFITGLIIALVLSPQSKWFIPVVASTIAIVQKHLIRYRGRHIFNPANFGLLSVLFIFSAYPSWWGQSFWLLIVLVGCFVCYKMKRLLLPIAFIGVFTLLFALDSYFTKQPLFNTFLLINIFFVFVMLIEPKTTPIAKKGLILYAISVAIFSFTFFKLTPQYDFSILALASSNLFVPFLNKLR